MSLWGLWNRFREFGAISRTCQNPPCSKPWYIAQGFAQNRPNVDSSEFTLNRHKESRKELQIILQGFRRRFREFGAISRTYQNPPCWNHGLYIAQGFCSKSAKLRLLRIYPKSTRRVAKAVKNPFMRALEPFQTVWSDFQDLPKSTMFKTMGYI